MSLQRYGRWLPFARSWAFFLPLVMLGALAQEKPPNVMIILADDLGFSDIGAYGGEIATPQLDRLAEKGKKFSQFYNTARCWPSRAAILTGYYPQQIRRDHVPGVGSGGRGVRPEWAPLLPHRLRGSGYRSYHSGKWHLDGMPLAQGFDRSYYLKDQGRFFNPKVHHEDDKALPPVEPNTDFYGTTAIADHAIRCLKEHAEGSPDRPFFHYLAFTAPHFPLHALPQDIKTYQNRYEIGWDRIRQDRWQRQLEGGWLGATKLSPVESDLGPPYHFPKALEILGPGEVNRPLAWAELDHTQREFQAMKMSLHAAMIDRMDREIGRVIDQLRSMEALDDTLIVFLSDNGASAEIMVRADGHDPEASPGSAATYLCLGPGWSTACNTPFRKHKTWVHEGGIATPCLVHWPKGLGGQASVCTQTAHVIDLLPTILDLAGIDVTPLPGAPAFPGRSLLGHLRGKAPQQRALWWQHEGHRAFRQGDWKIVATKDGPWELYNLSSDRTETEDLARSQPERRDALAAAWEAQWASFQATARAYEPKGN